MLVWNYIKSHGFQLHSKHPVPFNYTPLYFPKMHFNTTINTKCRSSKLFFHYETCEAKTGDIFKKSVTITDTDSQHVPPIVALPVMPFSHFQNHRCQDTNWMWHILQHKLPIITSCTSIEFQHPKQLYCTNMSDIFENFVQVHKVQHKQNIVHMISV